MVVRNSADPRPQMARFSRQRVRWPCWCHSLDPKFSAVVEPELLRSSVVVSQYAAQSFSALDRQRVVFDFFARVDQPVFQSLMISLSMIMSQILFDSILH